MINGTTYNIINVLATKMNFSPEFVLNDKWTTLGRKDPKTGKWSGMIENVLDNSIEIAANGYWRTVDRMDAVHFTFPFDYEQLAMLIQKTSEDHKYLFLTPFTWDVSPEIFLI